ncbi:MULTISPECIES: hypothetical protein [unclassified Colwellia]|uniref:hypothetical protein n=1 Tax=unclassified Colwellia TaxID=196834 RepID=UPI001C715C5F|nr:MULTISPECIES: hypothetical protein [unclassified Colwellia]
MNKNEKENRLTANAKLELQKTQTIADSEFVKTQLQKFINNKLRDDIITRDDLIKDNREPDKVLIKNIEGRQEMLDDLIAEVNSNQIELLGSFDVAKQAISELRKVAPKKAEQLENSLIFKISACKTKTINKKVLR